MVKSAWELDFDELMGNKPKKNKRQPISGDIKSEVMVKQKYKCANCGESLPARKHFHHKKPVSEGGKNTTSNLIALCPNCHSKHHHKEAVKKANKKAEGGKKKSNSILDWEPPEFKF